MSATVYMVSKLASIEIDGAESPLLEAATLVLVIVLVLL